MKTAAKACPNAAEHTEGPSGYVSWFEWAGRMQRTHRQTRCPGCRLYKIWAPRKPLDLAPRGECEVCGEPCSTPPQCRDCAEAEGRADVEAAAAWRESRPGDTE